MFFRSRTQKSFDVKVLTFDSELKFSLETNVSGKFLFDLVCGTIGLREIWYFGLQYDDSKGNTSWLRFNKKVLKQGVNKTNCTFMLCAKYYPENVTEDLIQEITRHLFYLQTKHAILKMDIFCPPEASVLLASYAVQAHYGDYDETAYKPGMLASENLLPQRVIEQYQMTPQMWEERIRTWYADHRGMSRDEAQMEYLKIAQDLQMYGVNYFPIMNKKLTTCWLGVTSLGLNVYPRENQLSPCTTFQWSEIRHISFDDKKFTIKLINSRDVPFIFYSEKLKINKLILELCVGNHDLYIKRRKPETMEIQQMKAHAKEEKQRRQIERNKLLREKQLREAAERDKLLMEEKIIKLQADVAAAKEALIRSEETAELLSQKNRLAEEETLLLSHKNCEVEQKISKMRMSAQKTEEEKLGLEKRTKNAEMLSFQLAEESKERSMETERLKSELILAKVAEKEAKERLLSYLSQSLQIYESIEEKKKSKLLHLPMDQDIEELSFEIEKEKDKYLSKSRHIESQLHDLRQEIEFLKIMEKQCPMDVINAEQLKTGENKYSTLKKLKLGSAKSRVAFFEDL